MNIEIDKRKKDLLNIDIKVSAQTLSALGGLILHVAQVEFSPGSSASGISPYVPLQSGNSTHYFGLSANVFAESGYLILQVAQLEL